MYNMQPWLSTQLSWRDFTTHRVWRQRFPSAEYFPPWRLDEWSRDHEGTQDHGALRSTELLSLPPSAAACELNTHHFNTSVFHRYNSIQHMFPQHFIRVHLDFSLSELLLRFFMPSDLWFSTYFHWLLFFLTKTKK